MRKTIISIVAPILQRYSRWYFSKPRKYHFLTVKGVILPGVFHPQFTISTKLLMQYISAFKLTNKSVLELGCGSGLIGILAAQSGASVTATDINPKAIENTLLNAKSNAVEIQVIESDLLDNVSQQQFDYILINPPYYQKKAQTLEEKAWFCGENFEYFERLFSQLKNYFGPSSFVIMILSEDCELKSIQQIAQKNKIEFELQREKKVWGEKNYVFRLKSI